MKKFVLVLLAVVCWGVAGCSPPSNMIIGNNTLPFDLGGQRVALSHVVIVESFPDGGQIIGQIEASRCHRYTNSPPPTEDNIRDDLKILSFAKGADAITGVQIVKESAMSINCWYILKGLATMLTLPDNSEHP